MIELDTKVKGSGFLKNLSSIIFIIVIAFWGTSYFAQNNKDSIISVYSTQEYTYNKILDYSRPGKHHQLLADLVGNWTFKGRHFDFIDSTTSMISMEFSGKLVREAIANGRYFIVTIDGDGKLEMPIQDGKMKETEFHGIDLEGYDNVKNKFIKNTIGNHLYSSIVTSEGAYDSTTKTITFESEFEPIPGMTIKDHLLIIFIDNDHYKAEYYQIDNGKYRKGSEIDFLRSKEK
ncbi:Protein of unknown function [Flaviramulus basaltis]|uniref:DUF1579 domain-containing protein n=1 Tax=Flaviramulus basaltis TaxID=369401 RepID=A0A1K2ICP4_9FLAO|nr:DUF1579 family protein [Flaviramulus basaltis]SFZ90204.1 Protein of unknown function [Flaviramulus basaltis]